ncbi:MAG: hypothetical protein ABSG59_07740 [Verrucomicrobiota bacterium]|jgi:hypothetical protein
MGAAILLVGLCSAYGIWIAQDRIDRRNASVPSDAADQLATLDSRKQLRQIELYYGKSGVLVEEWTEWLEGLVHGKRFAASLAVTSSILGIGCFFAANRHGQDYGNPTTR